MKVFRDGLFAFSSQADDVVLVGEQKEVDAVEVFRLCKFKNEKCFKLGRIQYSRGGAAIAQ